VVVAVIIVAALLFGLYYAYNLYQNLSFPATERPFANYATVTYSAFNGTEFYFMIQWNSSSGYAPLYTQLSSDQNSSSVFEMNQCPGGPPDAYCLPFKVSATVQLTNVDLYVAAGRSGSQPQFTIDYHVDSITASPGPITA
jgi:hypothetical protein